MENIEPKPYAGTVNIHQIIVDEKTGEIELDFSFEEDFVIFLASHLNKNLMDVTDREIKAYVYNQFTKQLKEQYQLEQFRAEASAEAADNTLTETVDTNDTQA